MHLAHDRYYAYDEFTANLQSLAKAHANLAELESIGQSHRHREIWALTPGYADQALTRLPFKYVTRPIYPLDTDFEWHPTATNIHGYID